MRHMQYKLNWMLGCAWSYSPSHAVQWQYSHHITMHACIKTEMELNSTETKESRKKVSKVFCFFLNSTFCIDANFFSYMEILCWSTSNVIFWVSRTIPSSYVGMLFTSKVIKYTDFAYGVLTYNPKCFGMFIFTCLWQTVVPF